MDIRYAKRELQDRTILVVHEAAIVEAAAALACGLAICKFSGGGSLFPCEFKRRAAIEKRAMTSLRRIVDIIALTAPLPIWRHEKYQRLRRNTK
jgi:hypothetical protein